MAGFVYIVTCVSPDSAQFTRHHASRNASKAVTLAFEYVYGGMAGGILPRMRDQLAARLRKGKDAMVYHQNHDNGTDGIMTLPDSTLRKALCERLELE